MSTVLPNDTKLAFPSYTIVSASAGSGKTYTLTQRFVQLLLSDNVRSNGLRNILAITFTNQAAAEMRRRLISFLKLLALGNEKKLAETGEFLAMPASRIQEKARVALAGIFDNYSDLQIKTIDSFMATVFKTSSFEFGFQPDLNIVFDNRPLLTEAFARMTRELSRNPDLRETLADIVELITETRSRKNFVWDPYSRIQWEVRKLYSQLASREKEIHPGEGIGKSREIKARLRKLAGEMREAIDRSGIEITKNFGNDLRDVETGDVDAVIGRSTKTVEKTVKKAQGGIGLKRYEALLATLDGPLNEYNLLLNDYTVWLSRNYYKPYVDAIAFVGETLDGLKKRKGEIFIDDINRLLRPHLKEQQVVDAYLMLGEQIYHFLIDEFQDTSPIQWANLRPLVENSLSQGGSLFVVGDRKQSIYAFRNADWRIMDRLMKENEFPSAEKSIIALEKNWRSHEKVIRYVSHVFENNIRHSDFGEAAGLSGLDHVSQEPKQENRKKGVVDVTIIDWDEDERPERAKVLSLIKDCRERGYAERDIAILTPQNDRVLEVSSWLNEEGYHVLPYSSLDIRTRKIIGELIALLKFLDSPSNDLAFSTFLVGNVLRKNLLKDGLSVSHQDLQSLLLTHANQGKRIRTYKKLQETNPDLWINYFKELFRLAGYLPLYDLVAEVYRTFRMFDVLGEEESSLVKFLEIARNFGEMDSNSLKDFVEMVEEDGEASFWQVQVPESVEAIRVMTIHKSKGLEFPVVIVLLYDRDIRNVQYFFSEEEEGTRLLRITKPMAERIPSLGLMFDEQGKSSWVDNLNKLYVALTRAQHEMFVVSLRGERELFPSPFLSDEPGELALRQHAVLEPRVSRETFRLRHTLRPVEHVQPPFAVLGFVEMARGEFVHRILSQIEYLDGDPGEVLSALIREDKEGLFPALNPDALLENLASFLATPVIASLFSRAEGRNVLREIEFATAQGSLMRLDRVLVDAKSITVIDFKTGSQKVGEHHEQVTAYKRILSDIYPGRECRGILAFVDQRTVEAV